ncbi:cytochrome P450 72A11-like isoform X2 [Panicum miliaceum]|uniref:Cytochrome P450 72A11-like isoform X2 n=1 Tax=Panicum miliaceum TaxID=4540 RepID=A0A3L6SP29_PANMI|nr:cytochrome P450 72A11-like isoform X2 [Panicum miliaceum]
MGGGAAALLREASPGSLLAGAAAVLLLWWAAAVLEWTWLGPRRMERALRAQGLRGTRYRFLWGDLKEERRLTAVALARPVPMDRPHDVLPRVSPLLHRAVEEHATRMIKLLIGGVAILDGEKWFKHRRIMNPAFHAEKLKGMLPAFSAACTDLICRWENLLADSAGTIELDVWSEFQNFSGDVISRAVFGVSYQEGRRIFLLEAEQLVRVTQAFRTSQIPGFSYCFNHKTPVLHNAHCFSPFSWLCKTVCSGIFHPKISPLPLSASLLPTESNRRMKAINRETKTILRGIIEKRHEAMKNGEPAKDDLFGMLMESNMNYSESDGKSRRGITVEEVIEECKLFYFAGTETTAVLLTYTMAVLSMHPEWLGRARDVVLQVFGENKPDFSGASRLKVVTMVLYEVLRLYPPALFVNRRTHKQTELGGVMYPPDVTFVVPIMFIHRDPALWGHDAGEFNPGRFAEGVSKACSDPGAFIPFSWGPRICIGQNFALLEAELAISMVLQRFEFELW